tara:strand:- start:261 stop:536 length:276 start_codon:yes stop_codon:yes gene_type:complete
MSNESIASIPVDLTDPILLRKFLVRLVEKLDVLYGYRGGDPVVTSEQLQEILEARDAVVEEIQEEILDINGNYTFNSPFGVLTGLDDESST